MTTDKGDTTQGGDQTGGAASLLRLASLSPFGLILGTLFFAASLTPSLVPRPPVIQGALGGFSLAAGYGIAVALQTVWRWLGLPGPRLLARRDAVLAAVALCAGAVGLALWWSAGWQDGLRAVMGMEPIDAAGRATIAATAVALASVLLLLARLFALIMRFLARRLEHRMPGRVATIVAVVLTALLFWSIGDGVLVRGAMRTADATFQARDRVFEATSPQPTDPLKTGAPGSLLAWEGLGRAGREMIARGPTRAQIAAATGRPALEPLRVYAGLNSAETPRARAELALAELIRIGAFDRSTLVIVTPTGTGWVDPEGQSALEFVLGGDVATVAVQYSYLASWIALLAQPEYGVETAQAVFAAVYDHWSSLPRDARPRLYLNGLSLGAYNSDLSHDTFQVIGDPFHGALWAGPPFNTRTWVDVTRARNPDTPAWLPMFRDGSVVRFLGAGGAQHAAPAPWGGYRVVFLQYASDAITFYDPASFWRKPDWMAAPIGPDVSPDFRWIPVVTFLQLTFDMMFAVAPPMGHGHVYAFGDYVDAWASLTGAPGWTPGGLDALKRAYADGFGEGN
ncbi:alpha/beta hydrolase [Palleronia sp. KMU-117]|uniref:alpha/beta hydrolase n=1 Tax=Palleronia sp. KMU-117 TaxID=3434108 RepID=UPI003D763C93